MLTVYSQLLGGLLAPDGTSGRILGVSGRIQNYGAETIAAPPEPDQGGMKSRAEIEYRFILACSVV